MTRVAVLALALVLLAAGCGGGDENASDQAAPPASSDCQPLSGATTDTQKGEGPTETMFLTGVDVNALECSDRVVFGFREDASQAPGYEIKYEDASHAIFEDTAGNPIEVAGEAFLIVALTPVMTADVSGETTEKTYSGPNRIPGEGSNSVQEVVKTDDFESVVTWVIGLDEQQPFTTKATKSQLVIEIGNS